jgi:hypothetical protein
MLAADKKTAIADYRKRKTLAGIYQIGCAPSGQIWVGQAPNIDTIQTRIWFTLRQGGPACATLAEAWRTHGIGSFSFEILDLVDEEHPHLRQSILKERLASWRQKLGALVI